MRTAIGCQLREPEIDPFLSNAESPKVARKPPSGSGATSADWALAEQPQVDRVNAATQQAQAEQYGQHRRGAP